MRIHVIDYMKDVKHWAYHQLQKYFNQKSQKRIPNYTIFDPSKAMITAASFVSSTLTTI